MRADGWLLPRDWPSSGITLLLKACLLPDDDQARAAWKAWIGSHDFDAVTRHDIRLLANLSTRMGVLDPDSPFRPRMEGLARSNWTQTQLVISGAIGAVDCLTRAGMPFLLFKGAAQYAEGIATGTRRIMGDLDILVPVEDMAPTIDALTDDGWVGAKGDSAAYLRAVAGVRIGVNLQKGRVGEVDLHRSPFHASARDALANARVWATAREASLHGRTVRVAAPEINVIITLAHAFSSPGGDWAIDVATRMRRQEIDWDGLLDLASRWRQTLPVRLGLAWLRDTLRQPVPDAVIARLEQAPVSLTDRLQFWSMVRTRERSHPVAKQLARQALTATLRRRGDVIAVSDRTVVQIVGSSRVAAAFATTGAGAGAWGTEAPASLPAVSGPVVLTLEAERPARRRRVHFDITAAGQLVAHVRVPMAPGSESARVAAVFTLPAGTIGPLMVSSRPTRSLDADDLQPASRPVRFRGAKVHAASGLVAAFAGVRGVLRSGN